MAKVKTWVQAKRHDRSRGACSSHSSDKAEDAGFAEMERAITLREGELLDQEFAFAPVMKLAGDGAGVGLESGENDGADGT